MKERLTKGWTLGRVLYVALGAFVVAQSLMQQQWLGVLLGGYFASMGLFSFGCAAGGCLGGAQQVGGKPVQGNVQPMQEVEFEEIKL
jgi:arginine exporter protein ArgO